MADLSVYRNQVTLGQRVDENRQKRRAREMQEELYQQGKQEFEMKKQEAALKQQQAQLNPFEGTGFDQQVANLAFQDALRQGMNREDAQKYAADKVLGSRVTYQKDPTTDAIVAMPGRAIFGSSGGATPSRGNVSAGGVYGSATGEGGYATPTLVAGPSQGELLEPPMLDGAMPQPEARAPARTPVVPQGARAGSANAPQTSLFEQADKAFGVWPTAVNLVGNTVGQFFPGVVSEDIVGARKDFIDFTKQLVTSLQNSPQFADNERKSLEQDVGTIPSAMKSGASIKVELRKISENLRWQYGNAQNAANNPNLPSQTRKRALEKMELLKNAIARIGVPPEGQEQQAPAAGGGVYNMGDDPLIDKYLR